MRDKVKHAVNQRALDVDHDTGEFRGILCTTCNSGIGKLGDDIESVEKALNYLKHFYNE